MLLSKHTLDQIQEDGNETKLDRIKTYVAEQSDYIHQYASPSTVTSVPSSFVGNDEDDDAISRAFTASISELLRRKYANKDQSPVREQTKKKKSVIEIDPMKHTPLPKSKSNGFHLLEKFVSPNLEINRVTLKSNHRKKPRIGLFNKGKSSSNGKTVPDLVFSEAQFLQKRKSLDKKYSPPKDKHDISTVSSTTKPPTISRFFKQASSATKHNEPSEHYESNSAKSTSKVDELSPSLRSVSQIRKRKQEEPISITSSATSFASLIKSFHQQKYHEDNALNDTSFRYQNHYYVPFEQQNYENKNNESFLRQDFGDSIVLLDNNQSQTPLYSYMRTPTRTPRSSIFSCKSFRNSHQFIPRNTSNEIESLQQDDMYTYHQNQPQHEELSFHLNWQVDESVAAPSQKDDIELILESPAIHLLNQHTQDQDEEIQNFWLNQSYKRKL